MMGDAGTRFREQSIVFRDGVTGRNVDVPSASPLNYHQAVAAPERMPRTVVDGKLFVPAGRAPRGGWPLVMIVPGSLGVDATHLAHAEALVGSGSACSCSTPSARAASPPRSPTRRSTRSRRARGTCWRRGRCW